MIFKLILFIITMLCVAPALAFLCMKWGVVGFLRGKEVSEEKHCEDVQDNNQRNEN